MIPALNLAKEVVEKECFTKFEFTQMLKDMCFQTSVRTPLVFISMAIFLDLVEYFMRPSLDKDEILFKLGFYSLSKRELYLMISTLKTISLFAALLFVYMGSKAWK